MLEHARNTVLMQWLLCDKSTTGKVIPLESIDVERIPMALTGGTDASTSLSCSWKPRALWASP
jgi:hypothetical protein